MALFGNRQEANLRACEQMVESVLAGRGLDAEKARVDGAAGPAWGLTHGSARLFVYLTRSGSDNVIQVMAPLLCPPADALAGSRLCRRLLELNAGALTGAAFGLRGDEVVLTADRSTDGLDLVEVEEMIRRVAEYADHFDDELLREFGGHRPA